MSLKYYDRKRNFGRSPEPRGRHRTAKGRKSPRDTRALTFVVQKHAARRLHYDLRLEMAGVLVSWAVPKGPSLNPQTKRLAVQVEDHPLEYGSFEGTIPQGEYGAGKVIVWDTGRWESLSRRSPGVDLRKGRLTFLLMGKKLRGKWSLVRVQEEEHAWLLIKHKDQYAQSPGAEEVTDLHPQSVLSRRRIDEKRLIEQRGKV